MIYSGNNNWWYFIGNCGQQGEMQSKKRNKIVLGSAEHKS